MSKIYFNVFLISGAVFLLTIVLTYCYTIIAKRKNILAKINSRSLHKSNTPTGGGIVFSGVFICSVIWLWIFEYYNDQTVLFICIGGGITFLSGFLDDLFDINKSVKLLIQIFLGIWILYIVSDGPLSQTSWMPDQLVWLAWVITLFILVWIMNIFNFMDGIDGLAASGTLFICWIPAGLIFFLGDGYENAFILFLLGTVCLGFLVFNFPPASIFMGDSGSLFLGYIIGALTLKTIMEGDMSVWTWCIISGYFLADTTTTTLIRIIMGKRWFRGAHRNHAYQNLARLWDSHLKVTVSILIFHMAWLFPLALISVIKPEFGPVLFFLGLSPVTLLTLKFGPRYSSD